MTAAPAPRPRPQPLPRAPQRAAPLPARLGGGAHSSSSNSSSGGDSSGAPGRSGLRAFQRVWTSMPAGRGARVGARGRTGRGARPGQRTQRGRHNFRESWEQAPAGSLCGGGSREDRLARSPTGGRARPRPRGAPGTPRGSLPLASPAASASCSPPPRRRRRRRRPRALLCGGPAGRAAGSGSGSARAPSRPGPPRTPTPTFPPSCAPRLSPNWSIFVQIHTCTSYPHTREGYVRAGTREPGAERTKIRRPQHRQLGPAAAGAARPTPDFVCVVPAWSRRRNDKVLEKR